jgi:hypothetical protein
VAVSVSDCEVRAAAGSCCRRGRDAPVAVGSFSPPSGKDKHSHDAYNPTIRYVSVPPCCRFTRRHKSAVGPPPSPAVSCFQLLPRPRSRGRNRRRHEARCLSPRRCRRNEAAAAAAAAAALAAKAVLRLVNDMLHHNGSFGLVLHQSSTSPALAAKVALHLVNDILHHNGSFELCTPPVHQSTSSSSSSSSSLVGPTSLLQAAVADRRTCAHRR